MIITEVKRTTKASREMIWKLWSDVENWKVWDKDVENSCILGSFKVGARGTLKSKGGPKTDFTITECTENVSFTDISALPLCKIKFIHLLNERSEGLEICHSIEMSGALSFLFARLAGKQLAKGVPQAVEELIALAENTPNQCAK
jgi:hypothetical protein